MTPAEYAQALLRGDKTLHVNDAQEHVAKRAKKLMAQQLQIAQQIEGLDRQRAALDRRKSEVVGGLNEIGSILWELRDQPDEDDDRFRGVEKEIASAGHKEPIQNGEDKSPDEPPPPVV